MARKNDTAKQIIAMLREAEVRLSQGEKTGEICRALGISEQSYDRWRREYDGLKVTQAARLKALEKQNARLRKAVSNLTRGALILEEVVEGTYQALRDAVLALPMRVRCWVFPSIVHAG